MMSLQVARAFLVKMDNLRGSPVVSVNNCHLGLMHVVRIPRVACSVHGDALRGCLLVRVEAFRHLPLDAKSFPPKNHHRLGGLGRHTTFVKDQVDVVLQPLGVGVDCVPLEGHGQEVAGSPVGCALLLLLVRGEIDVDDAPPPSFWC